VTTCPGVVPVLAPDGHAMTCANCGRDVATYGRKQQHKRGGSGGTRPLRPSEASAMLVERMAALERHQASALSSLAAIDVRLAQLSSAIEGFMARQPIVLEVRPRHDRQADGGPGGREETRRSQRQLRKVAGA
jgi:hypothetical protein